MLKYKIRSKIVMCKHLVFYLSRHCRTLALHWKLFRVKFSDLIQLKTREIIKMEPFWMFLIFNQASQVGLNVTVLTKNLTKN